MKNQQIPVFEMLTRARLEDSKWWYRSGDRLVRNWDCFRVKGFLNCFKCAQRRQIRRLKTESTFTYQSIATTVVRIELGNLHDVFLFSKSINFLHT